MGINNRKRRAAKQRKRAKHGTGRPTPPRGSNDMFGAGERIFDDRTVASGLVLETIHELDGDSGSAGECAKSLLGPGCPVAARFIADAVDHWIADMTITVLGNGWTPSDLAEIVRRRAAAWHLPALAAILAAEADRHAADRVSPEWREELARLGAADMPDLRTVSGLELALGLAAVLSVLPPVTQVLPPPGAAVPTGAGPRSGTDHKQLARVRALLAKAESTEYADEAEALSAKAQELISRYALDRLIQQPADTPSDDAVMSRRLWIDAPYVLPKAMLIDQVAGANRCRAVTSDQMGFCTIIGDPIDLESVEVMTTSLLMQAHTAMMTHGRHTDRAGNSRTTSFRRSFLIAYASRIGERLRTATQDAAAEAGHADVLLPALRRRAEDVDAACEEMFPHLVERATSISNGHGWAAGRAAADLAHLDANLNITQQAG